MAIRTLPLAPSLLLSLLVAAGCQPGTDAPEPEPLAKGPWVAGAPPSWSVPGAELADVPAYSAALAAPPVATLSEVRARAAKAGVRVASIDARLGVPSLLWAGGASAAAAPEAAGIEHIARLRQVYALPEAALATATTDRIHDTGRGAIVVRYGQEVGGLEVYRTAMNVVMDRSNHLVALSGTLHPAARPGVAVPAPTMSADEALALAVADAAGGPVDVLTQRVRPVLYPLVKSLEPAQRVEMELIPPGSDTSRAYEYVIADDGRILERMNRTASESFTYRVWADATPPFRPTDGPLDDFTPHPTGVPDGTAVTFDTQRLVTMESFNTNPDGGSDPWLPAGATTTTGNNVDAYADHNAPDGFSGGDVRPSLTGTREFDHTYNTGLAPKSNDEQIEAATVQLFYTVNWLHDYFYDSGFNEAAGNAQTDNFGRGGEQGDVLLAEAQDGSGTNNANMSTPSDGLSPRMQMFIFTSAPGVDRDGTLSNTIVAHEWGHYFHHRLSLCGNTIQCRSMSEGWGDFMALHMVVREGDDLDGVYGLSGYVTNDIYFGIRRVPYSTRLDRNALSFRHIGQSAALPTSDQHPIRVFGPNNEVHNAGEIWATMLTEAYFSLLREDRLDFDEAQRRMADYLVAGLLAMPTDATFVEARDAILAAAAANDPDDMLVLAEAFARRGAGTIAEAPARDSTSLNDLVESNELAGEISAAGVDVASDLDCDDDNNLDAGERGFLEVSVANGGPLPLAGTTVSVATGSAGVSFPDGATATIDQLGGFATVVAQIPIELADDVGDLETVTFTVDIENADSLTTQVSAGLTRKINFDDLPETSATDDVESQVVVWDALTDVEKVNWTRQLSEDQTNTLWHALAAPTLADQRLESPVLEVGDGDFIIEIDHRFKFEQDATANWDGGVIEISTDGGESWQDVGAAAGYGGVITDEAGNPLANREAYVGTSAGHPALTTQTINLGTAFAGQSVRIRVRLGTDPAVGDEGWQIDNITFQGISNTPFATAGADETDCPDPEPDPEPEPNPEDGGCGCQSSGGAGGAGLMLLLMLGVFARRRRA